MDTNDKKPLVSVRLMTYNHAPFIREAMDGIMMQEINFTVEVVVGDDFSTDGTLDIIRDYKDTENIRIKILEREVGDEYWKERQEKGRLYNFTNILENCTGKYIALLDGDDYWTDPKKLQKQVDFLEANNDFVCSFHDCIHIDESGEKIKDSHYTKKHKKVLLKEDLIAGGGMSTLTVVFRTKALSSFPEYTKNALNGDLILWSMIGKHGKAYFDESIGKGAYRIHGGGVYSMKDIVYKVKNHIATLEYIKGDIDSIKAKEIINSKIAKRYLFLAKNSLKVFEPIQFIKNIFLSMKYHFNSSVN